MSNNKYKQVKEVFEDYEANRYLKDGWELISAGFQASEEGVSQKTYILGSTESPKEVSSKLKAFLKE